MHRNRTTDSTCIDTEHRDWPVKQEQDHKKLFNPLLNCTICSTICSSITPVQPVRPAYITCAPCHHDKGAGFFQAVSSIAYQHGLPAEEEEDDEPDSRDAISGAVCCMIVHL